MDVLGDKLPPRHVHLQIFLKLFHDVCALKIVNIGVKYWNSLHQKRSVALKSAAAERGHGRVYDVPLDSRLRVGWNRDIPLPISNLRRRLRRIVLGTNPPRIFFYLQSPELT